MIFEYPAEEDHFERIQGRDQLREMLQEEALRLKVGKQFFRLLQQKNKYIYARCR